MAFEFVTRSLDSKKDLDKLTNYLYKTMLSERFPYPNVGDWIMKTEFEMQEGIKNSVVTWYYDQIVANFIYQTHKEISTLLEIKNIRSLDLIKHRGVSTFQWKQIEFEEKLKYDAAIVDTRADNLEMCGFLEYVGFKPIGTKPLYNSGDLDVVYLKEFRKNSGTLHKAKNLIIN